MVTASASRRGALGGDAGGGDAYVALQRHAAAVQLYQQELGVAHQRAKLGGLKRPAVATGEARSRPSTVPMARASAAAGVATGVQACAIAIQPPLRHPGMVPSADADAAALATAAAPEQPGAPRRTPLVPLPTAPAGMLRVLRSRPRKATHPAFSPLHPSAAGAANAASAEAAATGHPPPSGVDRTARSLSTCSSMGPPPPGWVRVAGPVGAPEAEDAGGAGGAVAEEAEEFEDVGMHDDINEEEEWI